MTIEITPASARPDASASIERSSGLMLMVGLPIAIAALMVALLPPVLVVMALQINSVSSTPGEAAQNLSLILGVGAFFAMFANPLAGRLSDRTSGRMGMRRP